jgi:drug/metabolite transporter (DMT)-like permease
VVLMAAGSFDAGPTAVVLPLVVTAAFAAVIVIARHRREVSMMPATCASQVLVVAACLPFLSLGSASRSDLAVLAALGVGQMGIGLAFLTIGARLIPPAQVAIISLLEVVLGPLWVWLAYDERPSAATLAGGAIVVAAVVVQAVGGVPGGRSAASEAHV